MADFPCHKEMEVPFKPVAVTPEQAAKLYGLSSGTLAHLRSKKRGPCFFKVGRKILYKIDDMERWLFGVPVTTLDQHRPEG